MHQNLLCILIHILKTPTRPLSSTLEAVSLFIFPFRPMGAQLSDLSPMETRTLDAESPGETVITRLQNNKKGNKNRGHIPLDEPKLFTRVVNVLHNAVLDIHETKYVHGGSFFFSLSHFSLFESHMVT